MNHRVLPLTLLCAPLVAGCFQEVDSGADKGSTPLSLPLDFGAKPKPADDSIPPDTTTPAIEIVTQTTRNDDPNGAPRTGDACEALTKQSLSILVEDCGACHGSSLNPGQGQPPWNFVDDPAKMMATIDQQSNLPFIKAGDPAGSRIYQRIIKGLGQGSMPPVYPDPTIPPVEPRPTISDYSVLHAWIRDCLK